MKQILLLLLCITPLIYSSKGYSNIRENTALILKQKSDQRTFTTHCVPNDSGNIEVSQDELKIYFQIRENVKQVKYRFDKMRMASIRKRLPVKKYHRIKSLKNKGEKPKEYKGISSRDISRFKELNAVLKNLKQRKKKAIQQEVESIGKMRYERYKKISEALIQNEHIRERYLDLKKKDRNTLKGN